jgi:hypothetical protein
LVAFSVVAVLCVLGVGQRLGLPLGLFDFDGEGKPFAAWSALTILSAGVLSLLVGRQDAERPVRRRWVVLGLIFAFMAVDEAVTIHEHIEERFNVDWQVAYAPLIATAGVAWLLVLRRIWALKRERLLLIAGAVCWVVAQIDEHIQSNPQEGRISGYGALSAVEETLELVGSTLFALAMLGMLQALRARAAKPREPSRRTASVP